MRILFVVLTVITCLVTAHEVEDIITGSVYNFVHEYDTVIPQKLEGKRRKRDLSTKETDRHLIHFDTASFVVPAFDTEFILDLELNKNLISANFIEVYDDGNGNRVENRTKPEHCYYKGKIRNLEDSSVVLSTCQGLKGMFSTGKDMFHIEPHDITGDVKVHVVYKHSDIKEKETLKCGHNSTYKINNLEEFLPNIETLSRKKRATFNQNVPARYIEVYIVNDHATWLANPDILQIRTRTISVANTVDSLYTNLNIRVVLTGVETWTQSDKITVSTSEDTTLDNFCEYKKNFIPHETIDYDVAQLITGVDLTGGVAGYGFVGTMCGEKSCAISERKENEVVTGQIMAHEMGHNLGMNHDNERSCGTCGWGGGCVMNAVVQSDPKEFTQCSVDDMSGYVLGCLNDYPTTNYQDPVCGNGIKETGEECDCGTEQECPNVDPCCEITGCRLKAASQCAEGVCCSGCQFVARGTVCRTSVNECDIDDICTGYSNQCPEDKFVKDGTACETSSSYCHTGTCQSRLAQCQYLLGSNAAVAADWCYDNVNIRGDQFGHCGLNGASYTICQAAHVQCGKLQCGHPDSGAVLPIIGTSRTGTSIINTRTVNGFTTTYDCKAGDADFGDDVPNPGMVVDGTKCGDGKWCVQQQCVSFTPASCGQYNGQECGGNGRCDYSGRCACNGNYDPGTNCGTTIVQNSLLECWSCADDERCGFTPNATNAGKQTCESNSQVCAVVRLERGQGAPAFYFRGCMYDSDCTTRCMETQQGFNKCTECCNTSNCNTGNGTGTGGGDGGGGAEDIKMFTILTFFLPFISVIYSEML